MVKQTKSQNQLAKLEKQRSDIGAEIEQIESRMATVPGTDIDAIQAELSESSARLQALRVAGRNLDSQIRNAQAVLAEERKAAAQRDFDAAAGDEVLAVQTAAESLRDSLAAFEAASMAELRKTDARKVIHPDRTSIPAMPLRTASKQVKEALQAIVLWQTHN